MGFLYFLLLIGPLIFFHELGHYLAARRFGVYCEEFAIGFGPKLASFRRWGTDFTVRALPIGGFVMLLDRDAVEDLPQDWDGLALQDKPPWQRALILLAGPLMNLLIPIPLLFASGVLGPRDYTPALVGHVQESSPAAAAGLLVGDEVLRVNGKRVVSFDDLSRELRSRPGEEVVLSVLRGEETVALRATLETTLRRDPYLGIRQTRVGTLGIQSVGFTPDLHVDPGSAAHDAGLRLADRVLRINGEPVWTYDEFVERLASSATPVTLLVRRSDAFTELPFLAERIRHVEVSLPAHLDAEAFGIRSARATIDLVVPGSPGDVAGLRRGDRIVAINGEAIAYAWRAHDRIVGEPEREHTLTFERDGELMDTTIRALETEVTDDLRFRHNAVLTGLGFLQYTAPPTPRQWSLGQLVGRSFTDAFRELFGLIGALILGVWFLVTGTVDTSAIGGPIAIAAVAGEAGRAGWLVFIGTMAVISVNLAIFNLLPIPGLDGGQLMFLTAEAIKRGPLAPRTKQIMQTVSMACLLALLFFIFKNDIERYWVDIRNWLNS